MYGGRDPASHIVGEAERYERLSYNIHMPEDAEFFLDFPPDKADLGTYCASLGHKVLLSSDHSDLHKTHFQVNHSFFPNSKFGVMWHPRWGRVRTVVTVTQVNKNNYI